MNTFSTHTDRTPPITTPGHLLANIPGLLGFYPTESVVFMAIDTTPRGPAMGPLARVDITDAQGTITDIAPLLAEHAREGVFAFLISKQPLTELREVSHWLYSLDRAEDGVEIDAAWYAQEITQNAPYILLHGTVNADGSGPMKKWVEGTIPALTDAPSMRSCVDHNVVPELNREDFFSVFAPGNSYLDAEEAKVLAQQARDSATRYREQVAVAHGKKRKDLLDHFLEDAQWALEQVASVEEAEQDSKLLESCAVWLATTWTRDLVVDICAKAGESGADLLLAAARTFSGELRANALTLFALAQLEQEWDILAGPALQLVTEEFPSHRLGALLCQAYRHGLHEKVRDSIHTGALKAYDTALGKEPKEKTLSAERSEPARRAAG